MPIPIIDPAWIAAIATAGGAISLKLVEHMLNRNKTSTDDARQIRVELKDQIAFQRDEILRLEKELEEWRGKYYDLRDSYMQQHTELTLALEQIRKDSVQIKTAIDNILPPDGDVDEDKPDVI